MFKYRLQRVKEGLHRYIEGGRVGDDGSEVVGVDVKTGGSRVGGPELCV